MRWLPVPDALDICLPDTFVSLVVDDGSELTPHLVAQLGEAGWPVVLMCFPDVVCGYAATALPPDLPVVMPGAGDEAAVSSAVAEIRDTYGPVGAVVYLHEMVGENPAEDAGAVCVTAAVHRPFILAKYLVADLAAAAGAGWAGFFTVTRMDGALGMTGQLPGGIDNLAAGGLTGLTKTLRLEWPTVACRAVDLARDFDPERAAALLMGEIRDPNRLVAEVGWGDRGRVTLETVGPRGETGYGA